MQELIDKAGILVEALPYIREFYGKTVVIKYGGKPYTDPALREKFAADVVLMKFVGINPVVVHGGGPQISAMMERLGKKPKFVKGVRVTDAETMGIVEMVLGGVINKEIVSAINRHGGRAVGLTGKDGQLILAKPLRGSKSMGQVGDVKSVDRQILEALAQSRFIPIIAPIGVGADGATYNINADVVAGALAAAVRAEKLVILTDVVGILDRNRRLISTLSRRATAGLIRSGVIRAGMLPKVRSCLSAVAAGVRKAHIIDGRVPHALLLETFTDRGVGTEITA